MDRRDSLHIYIYIIFIWYVIIIFTYLYTYSNIPSQRISTQDEDHLIRMIIHFAFHFFGGFSSKNPRGQVTNVSGSSDFWWLYNYYTIPITSMGLVYLPTFGWLLKVNIWENEGKQTIHGCYGIFFHRKSSCISHVPVNSTPNTASPASFWYDDTPATKKPRLVAFERQI